MLDWVEVGALSRPRNRTNQIFLFPPKHSFRCMNRRIVILENVQFRSQFIKKRLKIICKKFSITRAIEDAFNYNQGPWLVINKTTPYHDTAASMLNGWNKAINCVFSFWPTPDPPVSIILK